MITLKNFMVSIADQFQILINGCGHRRKPDLRFQVFKYGMKSFKLLWIFCKKVDFKFLCLPAFQISDESFKTPVECRLDPCIKSYGKSILLLSASEFNKMPFIRDLFYIL